MAPLDGRTILVTRAGGLADEIRALGAEVRVVPVTTWEPIDAASIEAPGSFDWVVFTSARAVKYCPFEPGDAVRVAVSGPETARAVEERGGRVDLVPEVHTAAALTEEMIERGVGAGTAVLFPCADIALTTVEEWLGAAGAAVTRLEVYRTVPAAEMPAGAADGADVVLFLAPSAVHAFVGLGGDLGAAAVLAIGPTTAEAVRSHGVTPEVAPTSDRKGMIEALTSREWK
jgi:uroporphyrinogen-III synthase